MLKLVLITPFLALSHLWIISEKEVVQLKWSALVWSFILFIEIFLLGGALQEGFSCFQDRGEFTQLRWGVFGVDGLSYCFLLLVILLLPICILVSWESIKFLVREFLICLFVLSWLLIGVFTIVDILGFYIFFEAVLIPMFIIVILWGGREEKIRAGFYFFFFTFFGSVFLLLGILILYIKVGATDYMYIYNYKINNYWQCLLFILFFLGFAIKVPLFPFHIWLPQAHVEAPVAGSVLLAGILLKLGGYGFLRFSLGLFPVGAEYCSSFVLTLGLLAVIYGSLVTCRQVDLKRVVAYSSVAHMGVVVLGLFSLTSEGEIGGVYLMFAHGLVSPGLFIAVTCLYDRYNTRLIRYYRGIWVKMPVFCFLFFLLTLANLGLPLSLNFVGEFLCLMGLFQYSWYFGLCSCLSVVLSAVYSLYLYNRVAFGAYSKYMVGGRDLNRREVYVFVVLLCLVYLLGICPNVLGNCLTYY